jgi:N-acetylglutamate synthase-like GNAT family acetyltransferase
MQPVLAVRTATPEDLPAIRALMKRARVDEHLLELGPDRHLLVLDGARGLAAAALFSIAEHRGHLLMLVVAPELDERHQLETRMFGVVKAMCDAFGATTIDVPGGRAA